MSPEAQRIAIAEACGYGRETHDFRTPPDYLNDLNAMHEAEKAGQSKVEGFWTAYNAGLNIAGALQRTHANAAQRAEAFLRTLGLWKD